MHDENHEQGSAVGDSGLVVGEEELQAGQGEPENHGVFVTSGGPSAGKRRFNRLALVTVVALCGLAGTIYLLTSRAETPNANDQPTYNVALPNPPYSPDAVMLKFKAGVPQAKQDAIIARYGAVKKDLPQIGVKEITVPAEALDSVITALSHNPAIDFAERDNTVTATDTIPNDPEWATEWGLVNAQAPKAWDTTTGSRDTVIALLDTGISFNLPDLQGQALTTGYDFINNDSDSTDDNGHGTSAAGVAGAIANNAIGVTGACWHCALLPIKIMDNNGTGTDSTLAQGLTYAADHGAKIINMSLGSTASSSTMSNAVKYAQNKGALLFAAAGNYGSSSQFYPAALSGVIGLAGVNSTDTLYSWSDYGSWVAMAASGCNETTVITGNYGTFCGTSSATPMASGLTGILWGAKPTATASQVSQALLANTDPCCSGKLAHGRINAYKAMQALLATGTSTDTTAPTASITTPTNGATVSGQVTVSVNASDNVGVTKVELYKNSVLYATSTTAPYSFYWDTTTAANGSYSLTAKAYDAAGNVGTSAAISVTVSNASTTADTTPPVVTVSSPTNGATISGKVNVSASATDNVGVVEMDVYIDGVLKTTSTSGSVSYSWNTNGNGTKKGAHTITVKAYDAAGNVGTSSVNVTK